MRYEKQQNYFFTQNKIYSNENEIYVDDIYFGENKKNDFMHLMEQSFRILKRDIYKIKMQAEYNFKNEFLNTIVDKGEYLNNVLNKMDLYMIIDEIIMDGCSNNKFVKYNLIKFVTNPKWADVGADSLYFKFYDFEKYNILLKDYKILVNSLVRDKNDLSIKMLKEFQIKFPEYYI
jgi:hypothetical protein